jgi:hypothetical protein
MASATTTTMAALRADDAERQRFAASARRGAGWR